MTTSSSQYSFGEALASVLARCGMSQTALAKRLGCHRNTIGEWIRGDHLPDRARLEDIIGALKCSPEDERDLREVHAGIPLDRPTMHNFPFGRTPFFTGREALLQQLQRRMAPGRRVAITQAITGLGGIGKTYLALEYAYRYRSDYSHVLWATADSPTTLLSEFVTLGHDLDLLPAHTNDQTRALRAVQHWLRTHSDWLLILDNVEDLSLVDGKNALVPPAHSGTILLTTRVQATEPIALPIEIACMSEEEGALFLLRRSRRLALEEPLKAAVPEDYRLALELSRTLGGLPLALDQAGAYIQGHCSFADYLVLYQEQRLDLLKKRGDRARERSDHPDSVICTITLAFERVEQESLAAADALRLCAVLAPAPIPDALFFQWEALSGTALADMKGAPIKFRDAIEVLRRSSLIQHNPDEKTISVHRLVQAVLRDSMTEPQRQQWEQRTVRVVAHTLSSEPDNPDGFFALLPHIFDCAGYIEKHQLATDAAADMLAAAGYWLRFGGFWAEAMRFYEVAVQVQQRLGREDPAARYWLGMLYYDHYRRYADAARMWERSGNPPRAAYRAYCRQYAEAEQLYQDAIRGSALAAAYYRQGRYAEAAQLYEQLYQDAIRGIEEEVAQGRRLIDPLRPISFYLDRLAVVYSQQGRYSDSEFEQLLQRATSLLAQYPFFFGVNEKPFRRSKVIFDVDVHGHFRETDVDVEARIAPFPCTPRDDDPVLIGAIFFSEVIISPESDGNVVYQFAIR